jgi:hypothetical protein
MMKKGVLTRVTKLLADVRVGKASDDELGLTREMTADEFIEHAAGEMAKLETDKPKAARKRLRVLMKAVEIVKALSWENTTTVKVPVVDNDDTTANKEKSEREGSLTTAQPAATLFSGNGYTEWAAKMRKRFKALKKSSGDPSENEDEERPAPGKKKPSKPWTAKYINDLPDASFLYIEKGSSKDSSGRTARDKRHFPVCDAAGKIDVTHLQKALDDLAESDAPGLDKKAKKALRAQADNLLADAKKRVSKRGGWPEDLAAKDEQDDAWGDD